MIAFNNMSVTFGQLVASAIGAGFQHVHGEGWRATVAIGAAPPIALAGLLLLCPESPRQLVSHGKYEAAEGVLLKIYPTSTSDQRQAKIKSIELSLQEATTAMTKESLWTTLKRIFTTPATGRAVLTACIVMAISQLGGFNTLMYYAATLFEIVGFTNATAVAITVSGTNFVFSIVNLVLVDKFGRRVLLTVTVLGMSICMMIAAVSFHYIPISRDLVVESNHIGWPATLVLVAIIVYVACFSSGVATIAWIGTELIPLEVRALGTMLVSSLHLFRLPSTPPARKKLLDRLTFRNLAQNTVTCWSTNIIIASTFLSIMKHATPSGAFGIYSGICFVGWLFIIFCYPECKGMPLETVREVFRTGFGVRYSKRWQREHKHLAQVSTQTSFGH
ncbi:hypothetical protein CLAIMM_06841 isoform 3 [Cladophialophora immunda]|nr:hypothetical protein CLAIMM_06841 isoform 1 [Cladophialophora immunda]OQV01496.1 hypothetical protein CLAIMM_06841 isoform 3 [Cladophialophora immunda]